MSTPKDPQFAQPRDFGFSILPADVWGSYDDNPAIFIAPKWEQGEWPNEEEGLASHLLPDDWTEEQEAVWEVPDHDVRSARRFLLDLGFKELPIPVSWRD